MTEYYLFATFVFILCLGMLVVMRFMFRIDKSDNKNPDMKEKEKKVLGLYEQIEDMLEGFEEYAEEVREEISAVKTETEKSSGQLNGSIDEEKIDAIIGEILDKKLDNKVSEAVRRIVSRSVKEEVEIAVEDMLKRIQRLEKRGVSSVIAGDSESAEVKEFMPSEFAKTPDTLEELGESIQKALKNNSGKETKGENKRKRRKVLELYNSGMSINDIAKEVGIASSEIKLIIEFLN